jgi:hypothetical protein
MLKVIVMKSSAKTVDEYMKSIPDARRDAIVKLRALCLKTLDGYAESMGWGMPCYGKEGEPVEVAFASQKNNIALYLMKHAVVKKNRALLKGLEVGKSCIKYSKPEKLDFKVVRQLLKESLITPTPPR